MLRYLLLLPLTLFGCCPRDPDETGTGGGGGTGAPADQCPEYCGAPVDSSTMSDRCVVAFGGSFAVPRQCPAGLVPSGCANYTDYSVGFVTACPGENVSQNVLCCED